MQRLHANALTFLQIKQRFRRRGALGNAEGPQRVRRTADSTLEPVKDPAHRRANSDSGFGDGPPNRVHQAGGKLGEADVSRRVVLDVLAQIQGAQRLRCELDLRVLTHISRFAFAGRSRDLDSRSEGILGESGARRHWGERGRLAVEALEPRLLPEDQTLGFTAIM